MSRRPSHQTLWNTTAGAMGAVCLGFGGVGLAASPRVWTGNIMIVAYLCGAAAVALFACGVRELRFPAARLAAEPSFPILPDPPPDDPGSEVRHALDAACSEISEALASGGVRRRLHGYCAKCGYPLGSPRLTPDCNGGGACDNRLHTPLAQRVRLGGAKSPLRVHPQWMAEHREKG
jgi:hypothetical protein